MGDLEAAGLARMDRAAERLERLHEERADEVRLEAAGLGLLHLLLHREEPLGAHGFLGEGVAVEDVSKWSWSKALSTRLAEAGADFGLVAVADGLQKQVLEAVALEDFAEDVEDAALERLALDSQLFEQAEIDVAFAGFLGDEVPEVADLLSGRCGGCGRSAVRGGSDSTAGRS